MQRTGGVVVSQGCLTRLTDGVLAKVRDKSPPEEVFAAFDARYITVMDAFTKRLLQVQLLCAAVEAGHLDILRLSQGHGMDSSSTAIHVDFCPVHLAVDRSDPAALEILIQLGYGQAVNRESRSCISASFMSSVRLPLVTAILQDDVAVLGKLLPLYESRVNPLGTALHVACRLGARQCVDFLVVQRPDDVTSASSQGVTPLYEAARARFLYGVRRLLDAGADATCLNSSGKSPLHGVCSEMITDESVEIVRLLVDAEMGGTIPPARSSEILKFLIANRMRIIPHRALFASDDWRQEVLRNISCLREVFHIIIEAQSGADIGEALRLTLQGYYYIICNKSSLRDKPDATTRYLSCLPEMLALHRDVVTSLLAKDAELSTADPRCHHPISFGPDLLISSLRTIHWGTFRYFDTADWTMICAHLLEVLGTLLRHQAASVHVLTFINLLQEDTTLYWPFLDCFLDTLPMPEQRRYVRDVLAALEELTMSAELTKEVIRQELSGRVQRSTTLKYICRGQILMALEGKDIGRVSELPIPHQLQQFLSESCGDEAS